MNRYPEQATQPSDDVHADRRFNACLSDHTRNASDQAMTELFEALIGIREQFDTWTKDGQPVSYSTISLAEILINDLPPNYLARCLVLVSTANEALLEELYDMLSPQIASLVNTHAEWQGIHNASLEARGLLS